MEEGGVLTTKETKQLGISYYYLQKYLRSKKIERIKQGVYRWLENADDEWQEVKKIVPKGVFCLFSAASLHELTTFISSEYHLAIPRKHKVILPEYPPIKIYYWKESHYELGIASIDHSRNSLRIYDIEKTVCDFIKYRNKLGLAITKEVIKNYLGRPDRNLNKLMQYAKQLRLGSIVQQYFEVIL